MITDNKKQQNNSEKVLCALSGGVDSAVCAQLLIETGYNVTGAMMRLHDNGNIDSEIDAAKNICSQLKIEFIEIDCREQFNNKVINYFVDSYSKGLTPNPCIECNRHLKFGLFMEYAKNNGYNKVATGHYARIDEEKNGKDKKARYFLKKAIDLTKDQSYVLYFLNQEQLSHILLPLGNYTKEEIRKFAKKTNLSVAKKPESQDICFIEDGDYAKFVKENSGMKPIGGNILDCSGKIVGTHSGIINYTIGQRKGINIAFGRPMYVKSIDTIRNQIVVGNADECKCNVVKLKNFHYINNIYINKNFHPEAKLRYRHKPTKCIFTLEIDDVVKLKFPTPVNAIAPGQFGVIYDGDIVVGGGVIT